MKSPEQYKRALPELAHAPTSAVQLAADRLRQLGLDPTQAASIAAGVRIAIESDGDRFYHPTTPGGEASRSPALALPSTWASPSTPLSEFLARILPADRGYDADLTIDSATGQPELRLRFRKEANYVTGDDRVFIEHWSTTPAASSVVNVEVLKGDGRNPDRVFTMPLAPFDGTRDQFIDTMAGLSMLYYQQAQLPAAGPRASSP